MPGKAIETAEKEILKEHTAHGTTAYPYAVYEWNGREHGQVDLHWHKETEIIFLKQGIFRMSVHMKDYVVTAPALVFVGAGEIHSICLEEDNIENAVVFDLQMLSFENYDGIQYKIIHPLLTKELCFPLFVVPQDGIWEELKELYEGIFMEAANRSLSAYLKIKASMYQLIGCLYEHDYLKNLKEVNAQDADRIDIMKGVLSYIRTNYSKKLGIADIAFQAGMNPQYFCRYFKRITGKTVINYLNDFRIGQAVRELADTEDKIIEIAGRCGYDNMGYFIQCFRNHTGTTPSAYRKEKKSK